MKLRHGLTTGTLTGLVVPGVGGRVVSESSPIWKAERGELMTFSAVHQLLAGPRFLFMTPALVFLALVVLMGRR